MKAGELGLSLKNMNRFHKTLIFFLCLTALFSILSIFSNQKPKYQLSICAIFRDEAPYLKEWIEFHKLQGVDHFFLYNNKSSDDYLAALQPYLDAQEATLIDWPYSYKPVAEGDAFPWLSIQKGAYTNCVKKHGKLTKWLAAIDIDEFLFCPSGQRLPLFLKNYEDYGGLCVNWVLFGTSNLASLPPDALMIENLVQCAPKEELRHHVIKSIVQPKYTKRALSAHEFRYKKGHFAVNALGDSIHSLYSPRIAPDLIRINHYWTRTEDHFFQQKIASRNARRTYQDEAYLKKRCENYNKSVDAAILQFVPPLKEKIFNR
jgi:Domain of unknown function.